MDFASSPPGNVIESNEAQKTENTDTVTEKVEENSTVTVQSEKSD